MDARVPTPQWLLPDRNITVRRGARLGVKATAIGSILFAVMFLIADSLLKPPLLPGEQEADIVIAMGCLILLIGPLLGFLIAIIPGTLGGVLVALVVRMLRHFHITQKLLVIFVGSVFGALLAFLIVGSSGVANDVYGESRRFFFFLSSILAGSIAGGWHAWKINRWLMEAGRTTLTTKTEMPGESE